MGVPAFFRWLSRKYPSVIIECVEKKTVNDDGSNVWECPSLPNPNGIEFDNLYLDMNGIIHPCTHPEDKPPPKNEDEMMIAIFECIDRLIAIVRPRKLIYMAIDGVAPRAKMNQQRSRRFRASKETVEKQLEIQRIKEKLAASGFKVPPEKPKEEHFDSNCITPGTPFMQRLSSCLHYYIHDRLNNHPGWKGVKVILSDANVPGEGEHKIMDYIRRQRVQPDHDPNTQHVLCGADADLIMLGLATHEPNFTIIREEFLPNKPRPCDVCGQYGHSMNDCQGLSDTLNEVSAAEIGKEVQFIFVRLCVLKEYLKKELYMSDLPFTYDFDRVLDDWVFMCFFVGNDFLPHLPSLEIREGAVDRLITLYKKCVYKTRDYLTDSGEVNLDGVQMIMMDLGNVEDQIFKDRQRREVSFKQREKAKKVNQRRVNFDQMHNSQFAPTPLGRGFLPAAVNNPRQEAAKFRQLGMQSSDGDDNQAGLRAMMRPGNDDKRGTKRKVDDMTPDNDQSQQKDKEEEEEPDNDEVRLYENGFKDRYYESKFDVTSENLEFRYTVALQYVRGLCWVLKYYYQGCVSWDWYFPYHYAPFASDFINITGLSTKFDKITKPFNPLEQLMGVFPAASSKHIPDAWAPLMSDPKSPIIDFYPEDFQIDLNGKKFAWQGVALLPFVDEKRLFKALKTLQNKLTDAEIYRNSLGDDRLYVGPGNPGYKLIKDFYKNKVDDTVEMPISIEGMQGNVLLTDECVEQNGPLSSPVIGLQDVLDNSIFTVKYKIPTYPENFVFPARRLPKAVDPPAILKPGDMAGNDSYKPRIGFNQNYQSARLDNSGFRAINHYANNNRNNRFSAIPPPSHGGNSGGGGGGGGYQNQRGGNNRDNYQNYNRGGGGGGSNSSNERYHPYRQGNSSYQSQGNNYQQQQQQQQSTYGQHRQQQQQQRSNNYSTGSDRGGGNSGSTNNRFQGNRNSGNNNNDSYNNQRRY